MEPRLERFLGLDVALNAVGGQDSGNDTRRLRWKRRPRVWYKKKKKQKIIIFRFPLQHSLALLRGTEGFLPYASDITHWTIFRGPISQLLHFAWLDCCGTKGQFWRGHSTTSNWHGQAGEECSVLLQQARTLFYSNIAIHQSSLTSAEPTE